MSLKNIGRRVGRLLSVGFLTAALFSGLALTWSADAAAATNAMGAVQEKVEQGVDEVAGEGTVQQLKGRAQEDLGRVQRQTGKASGQVEGAVKQVKGRAQRDLGRTRQAVDNATDSAQDSAESFMDKVENFFD